MRVELCVMVETNLTLSPKTSIANYELVLVNVHNWTHHERGRVVEHSSSQWEGSSSSPICGRELLTS